MMTITGMDQSYDTNDEDDKNEPVKDNNGYKEDYSI